MNKNDHDQFFHYHIRTFLALKTNPIAHLHLTAFPDPNFLPVMISLYKRVK